MIQNIGTGRLERFNFVSSIETPSFLGEHLIFVFTEISYFHKTLKLNIFGILLSSNFSSYTIFKLYIKEDFSKHVQSGLSSRAKHGGPVFSAVSGSIKSFLFSF